MTRLNNGIAFASEAKRPRPGIKVLFATGCANDVVRDDGEVGESQILQKPYRPIQASQAVERMLAA